MSIASAHLARIGARSRRTGGPGAAEARAYCAGVLRAAGFVITERSFEYSAFPASWAMPIAGAIAWIAAITLYAGRSSPALIAVAVTVVLLGGVGLALLGQGVLDSPVMRRSGVNLEATRPGAPPGVWLVAHADSKWQPVSMIGRVAGVAGMPIGLVALFVLALAGRGVPAWLPLAAFVWTLVTALLLILSVVGDGSHGAVDNASGVAAVLEAAEAIPAHARVGVLITDAEEFALAGARAWARTRPPAIALNCDSIDDDGPFVAMYSRSRPEALLTRLATAAGADAERVEVRRLIPGILTDSVALADAGWETLTLSRGTARTLRRIHTSRDTLSAMRGTGIAGAARILARVATELG